MYILPIQAFALELDNDPMETKIKPAPSNVMFLLDDSGSMDWEFMTTEDDGIFHSEYFAYAMTDNAYDNSTYALNGNKMIEWKSQWSGYNTIFYNPYITYRPWPRWETMPDTEDADGVTIKDGGTPPPHNADMMHPRSNPVYSSPTIDLSEVYYANLPLGKGVIVDNRDGGPSFTTTGSWGESSLTPEWEGSSYYTDTDGDRAVFTPDIPTSADYQVYAWWNCFSNRDRNALIEIDNDGDGTVDDSERQNQRSTTDDVHEAGVCGEWLPLFGGASFPFPEGLIGTVSIVRDTPNGSSTIADAIAFVEKGTDMTEYSADILNAHYYAVDDKNGDGIVDAGEVYLVNIEWSDDNDDSIVDFEEVTRSFYLVHDNEAANNREKILYSEPILYDPENPESDEVPDFLQGGIYDSDNQLIGYITDYEDLRNFANWFSFYRKRELTAKGAVSLSVDNSRKIRIGASSIHDRLNQPVLPIQLEATNTIVIDDRDSSFTSNGWETVPESSTDSKSPMHDDSYRQTQFNKSARWTPQIQTAGDYSVSAWWPCDAPYWNSTKKKWMGGSDQKARFTIKHSGGETVKEINQLATADDVVTTDSNCEDPSGTGCCGYWVDLGTYTFNQGASGYVEVERHADSTNKNTLADAVRFEGSGAVITDSTDELFNLLYSLDSSGGTPLRLGLKDIGRYFDKDDGNDGDIGPSPYYSEENGGSCQQAFAITMTDGFWNGDSPDVGNADSGMGTPYQDGFANTLADVAMYYYNTDLADSLPDELPVNNYDKRKSQHLVTFSVSFGREGSIPLDDIDQDGVTDDPGYSEDPYFLNPMTPHPDWGDPHDDCYACPTKIDDLWHASVNGRGRFFMANDPESLSESLGDVFQDIGIKDASGASVSVNGDELSSGLVLYQSTYVSGEWIGNLLAFPIDPVTGEIKKGDEDILWQAQDELQNQNWDNGRNIITYAGTPGTGVPFRYNSLLQAQKEALDLDQNMVDYLRGKEIDGFRSREKKLGDIVHSAPLLTGKAVPAGSPDNADGIDNDDDGEVDEEGEMKGGTIFAGGNDGMLHAFDAQTGMERFAYIPLHAFPYLSDLTKELSHRFYVDATPYAAELTFTVGDRTGDTIDNDMDGTVDEADEDYGDSVDNDGDGEIDEPDEKVSITLLVGALKKGGRGIYALDITNIENPSTPLSETALSSGSNPVVRWEFPPVPATGLEYSYAGNQSYDGVDNDGDGYLDADANEADDGNNEDYSDGRDNDGDGDIDEQGEMAMNIEDNDMGYSFSDPYIARSYKSYNEAYSLTDNPWVVIFGNGYDSFNGHAILYILDAWTGDLIRKIDTGAGGDNGLSTPALVDVDNDRRVDFVYAGDLLGNMWKFDLTDLDPENWGVAFGADKGNPIGKVRIDYADVDVDGNHDLPQPLFSAPGQPITITPDVLFHPKKGKGYLVVFGTGKFLAEADRNDTSQQSIFGIWDFNTKLSSDPEHYVGTWDRATNTVSNPLLPGVELLEQTEVDWQFYYDRWLRTLSDNTANWYSQCDDGIDNDSDGLKDDKDIEGAYAGNVPELCIPVSHDSYAGDGIDNDEDGQTDETGEETGHTGWFFDLPFTDLSTDGIDNDGDGDEDNSGEGDPVGERVIKDVLIREGKAIVISFIPGDSPCDGGGKSIVHEMDANDGSRMSKPVFDINGDHQIDENDLIDIGITDSEGNPVLVPPTGIMLDGILHTPVMVGDPDDKRKREMKIFSSSAGTTEVIWEKKEKTGFYYWREY